MYTGAPVPNPRATYKGWMEKGCTEQNTRDILSRKIYTGR